jgi:hypothetical protein
MIEGHFIIMHFVGTGDSVSASGGLLDVAECVGLCGGVGSIMMEHIKVGTQLSGAVNVAAFVVLVRHEFLKTHLN